MLKTLNKVMKKIHDTLSAGKNKNATFTFATKR